MAEFLKGDQLNSELVNIFDQAKEDIIIISPFIKLHSRIRDSLKRNLDNPNLKITVVFGKNENNKSKSLNVEELEFFKQFPNIEIKYEPRLHAKYYANETNALLSSMNLYEYYHNSNIEFGILTKTTLLNSLTNIGDNLDKEAFSYFETVIKKSELKFSREPFFEQKLMGLTKKYLHSEVKCDVLSSELINKTKTEKGSVVKNDTKTKHIGFCIRTGIEIPFNVKKPFSANAFESWNNFKNVNYNENFCHYSGEPSDGETSFEKPILKKNWRKSKLL